MRKSTLAAFAAAFALASAPVLAADHEVQMLNRGDAGTMVFEPAALEIEPGDTVTFVAADPGHNAETIAGMLPEGAESFRTAIGETVEITFDEPGLYGIKCTPHYAMGMVMLIQVGDDPANVEDVKAVGTPPAAATRFETAFEDLGL